MTAFYSKPILIKAGLLYNWSRMQVQWLLGCNALLGTKTATRTHRTGARHVSRPMWITAVAVTTSVPPTPTALPPARVATAAINAAMAGRIATPTVRMDAKPMWARMWTTAEAAVWPAPPTPTALPPAPEASADTLAPQDGRIATARRRTDARPMWARMWTTVEDVATSAPAPTLTLWPFAGSIHLVYSFTKSVFFEISISRNNWQKLFQALPWRSSHYVATLRSQIAKSNLYKFITSFDFCLL